MAPRGSGVPAPQQESRQREEHRDREVEPPEQPPGAPGGVSGLEGHVGDHHADGGARTHAFDGGQETAGAGHVFRPLRIATRFPVASLDLHGDQCAR